MYCNSSVYLFGYQSCSYQDSSRVLFLPLNLAKLLVFSLSLTPLLLLSSFSVQALSVYTSQTIEGTAPYLTFDGGRTRVTSTDSLLSIKLQDGSVITPSTNTSSVSNPIRLPYAGNTLDDIDMIVPSSASSVDLSDLITRYNYWGDDDGDGQGTSGITATGRISVSFTDKDGNTFNRSDALDICNAPYRVALSSTGGSLTTQYGVPRSSSFSGAAVDYYINPYNTVPRICHARPNLEKGTEINGTGIHRGPSDIWNPDKGFLVQSTSPSSYNRNFPTTGADGLYFDLDIGGIDASQLTWSSVARGGITATVTSVTPSDGWIPSIDRGKVVARVKLSGPRADSTQINSSSPSPLAVPSLPQTFELVGRDGSGNEVRYGFVLKQWFVHRNKRTSFQFNQSTWCNSLGYRLARVRDLTNAICSGAMSGPFCQGSVGATPSSVFNGYQRHIGAGFFTEWGDMYGYADAGFSNYYWTSDVSGRNGFNVQLVNGSVENDSVNLMYNAVCTAP
ncbi:hypothetical protein [Gilliamella sp. ESL0254]|uniref:hypothetical protein n=1 Tax=Gilliamella sp. ESL0254 TaxID=2705035 RepID=UPI001580831F|nr:hypothetical protein [Gilliamella sp. ESL0254]NUF27784.1 hypothetical protein [Gilliamella sp. ESL0254]